MDIRTLHSLLHHVRCQHDSGQPDSEILARFLRNRDADAFACLMRRHGAMVYNVCRRILRDPNIVEDVFQATFLVLAERGKAIRKQTSVAAWLHGVAHRLAIRVKQQRKPLPLKKEMLAFDPAAAADWRDLLAALDEELKRLPERYRLPLILCYLEGRTRAEAARQLGLPLGALRRRLEDGRHRLQARLFRRGFTLPATVGAVLLMDASRVPAVLQAATLTAALRWAAGSGTAGIVAGPVAALVSDSASATTTVPKWLALIVLLGTLGAPAAVCFFPGQQLPGEPARSSPPQAGAIPTAAARQALPPEPRTHRDVFGDPLPPGAVVRMGTVRLHHGNGIEKALFTADGNSVAAFGRGLVHVWNAMSGAEIDERSDVFALTRYRGGPLLALVGSKDAVRLWDLATRRPIGASIPVDSQSNADLSADGSTVAVFDKGTVRVWGTVTGKQRCAITVGRIEPECVQLSPDGHLLITFPENGFEVWDAKSGKRLHVCRALGSPTIRMAFAPDGKQAATIYLERPRIVTWDLSTGKVIRQFDPMPTYSVGGFGASGARLTYTGDGKTLVSGDERVLFWDAATGKLVGQLEPLARSAFCVALSPDEQTLATWGEQAVYLGDVRTGKHRPDGGHQGGVGAAALSPDGRMLATSTFGDTARLWDMATGRELRRIAGDASEGIGWVAFAPRGRLLATSDAVNAVRLWDPDTGRQIRNIPVEEPSTIAFSPDGTTVVAESKGSLHFWNSATGKETRPPIAVPLPDQANDRIAFAPDGAHVGVSSGDGIRVWDISSGKLAYGVEAGPSRAPFAFSPDGRSLARLRDWNKANGCYIVLCDASSGKEIKAIAGLEKENMCGIAFSPDSRYLAAGTLRDSEKGSLVVWELSSGKLVGRFDGHRRWVVGVSFTPDGRRIVSAGSDATALVWDLAELAGATSRDNRPLTASERQGLWSDLMSADAARAWRAHWQLLAAPSDAVALLQSRLRPEPAPERARVARLVVKLGSEDFQEREWAAKELDAIGDGAASLLRQALEGHSELETRRRIEQLLAGWQGPTVRQLIAARATGVLEQIGSPAARQLLESLAGGARDASLTEQARESLKRLGHEREQ